MTETSRPAFLGPDSETETLAEYRSVSRWAVAALVLGIISASALASPIFWLVPLAAMAVGAVALRRVGNPSLNLAGRSLALIGLALAIFFVATSTTRFFSRRAALVNAAQQHADQWLQLVANGSLREAHQLSVVYYNRIGDLEDLEDYYSPTYIEPNVPDSAVMPGMEGLNLESLEAFFAEPPLSLLVEHGAAASWELVQVETVNQGYSSVHHEVVLRYRLTYPENGSTTTVPMIITMERSYYPVIDAAHWKVDEVAPEWESDS